MNDLGWTLAWLSLQVAALLVPALGLQALASRRGPDSGSWVATWSLGLVVALGVAAFLPGVGPVAGPTRSVASTAPSPPALAESGVEPVGSIGESASPRAANLGRSLSGLRMIWDQLGRRALGPSARVHPWGWAFAVVALGGMGFGLIRLLLGLWAVGLSRRRGGVVDDGSMLGLVEELRGAMGCRPLVEIREVADLDTPATAGRRRPVLLLPSGWRSWDDAERRAVVAHELAHVLRGDFAAGLLARVAVVLNAHNPLVYRMAGRLHLEQELAADALGARFAGGRAAYLVALSGLALKQDGRSPSWPARAFLPTRGTLIRRIAMLRNDTQAQVFRQGWSRPKRLATALGLLILTIGAATLRGPARANDDAPSLARPADPKVEATSPQATLFGPTYMSDSVTGILAFHPAAALRHPGMARILSPIIGDEIAEDLEAIAKAMQVDISQPGFLKPGPKQIESIFFGFGIGKAAANPKDSKSGPTMHRIEEDSLTVRMVTPFDWLAFLRQWKLEVEEVHDSRRVYHKVKVPRGMVDTNLEFSFFVYLPDDRTLVINGHQEWIRELIRLDAPPVPALLRGADWERAGRGLLALAINNQEDGFSKPYDLGRPDDAMVVQCFQGVDRWVLGVADADALALHAEATARAPEAAESVARTIDGLVKLGRAALDPIPVKGEREDLAKWLARGLLANLKVKRQGSSVTLSTEGFGTLADVAKAELIKVQAEEANPKVQAAEATPKTEKR